MIWGFRLLHHNLTVTYFCDHLVNIMLGIRAGIGVEVDTKNKDCSACRMLKFNTKIGLDTTSTTTHHQELFKGL